MMKWMKKYKLPILIALVFVGLSFFVPDTAARSTQVTWDYFKEMVIIMPPVFILMGLMEAWIPKDKIQKWLGSGSGFRGGMISVFLGTLPTGPLYMAFPMAATLVRKGASITNIVLFLGSWAALKIPQLLVEIKFLGLSFTLLRFGLTLLALIIMGVSMDKILKKSPDIAWQESEEEQPLIKGPNQIKMEDA